MKRILSIQDLSCLGSSSLTAALPVASVMGVECVVLPTALLSAHTFFPDPRVQEVTNLLLPFSEHFKALNVHFDAICTGYLSSAVQAEAVLSAIDLLADRDTLVFVDPAMGDNGSLYPGLADDLPEAMAKLCARADVIVPNLTEAELLIAAAASSRGQANTTSCGLAAPRPVSCPTTTSCGWEAPSARDDAGTICCGQQEAVSPISQEQSDLLDRLLALGAGTVLLTGVEQDDRIGVVGRGKSGELSVFSPRLNNCRPGTGDLFSAVCASALVLGDAPETAVRLAEDFISAAIRATEDQPDARDYAVHFQSVLKLLCR